MVSVNFIFISWKITERCAYPLYPVQHTAIPLLSHVWWAPHINSFPTHEKKSAVCILQHRDVSLQPQRRVLKVLCWCTFLSQLTPWPHGSIFHIKEHPLRYYCCSITEKPLFRPADFHFNNLLHPKVCIAVIHSHLLIQCNEPNDCT